MVVLEIWGSHSHIDSLSNYFSNMLDTHRIFDVNLGKVKPAWKNIRFGDEMIANILNGFLIPNALLDKIPLFKQWVGFWGIYDHHPLYLELENNI